MTKKIHINPKDKALEIYNAFAPNVIGKFPAKMSASSFVNDIIQELSEDETKLEEFRFWNAVSLEIYSL